MRCSPPQTLASTVELIHPHRPFKLREGKEYRHFDFGAHELTVAHHTPSGAQPAVVKESAVSEQYLQRREQRFGRQQKRGGRSSGLKRLRRGSGRLQAEKFGNPVSKGTDFL